MSNKKIPAFNALVSAIAFIIFAVVLFTVFIIPPHPGYVSNGIDKEFLWDYVHPTKFIDILGIALAFAGTAWYCVKALIFHDDAGDSYVVNYGGIGAAILGYSLLLF
jgi:hypothetical protein